MGAHPELQARLDRANLLYQVSKVIHSSLDPHEALTLILGEAVRVMRATSGSIVLLNPTSNILEIEAFHGLPEHASKLRLRLGEGITGWVARTGQAARVGNVHEDSRYVMVRGDALSELAVPLNVDGETRGVLNVDSENQNAFSAEDESLLQELADQAAVVIRNTWLYEQLRLKARLFETLFSVGQTINSTLNVDEALQAIAREAAVLMEAQMCSLLLLDNSKRWLDLKASYGAGPMYLSKPRLNVEESLVGSVVRRKKPATEDDVQHSARYQNVEVARAEGLVSLLSVPLLFHGEALGAMNVYMGRPHSFSNEEIRILLALAEFSAIAIEKARLYEGIVDMEEQLRQSEKLSTIGLLAAEVAHEIRNPLTVMKMLYHSLNLNFTADDPRAKDAEIIVQKMDGLNRIVEQILDLARSNEPRFEAVNLNQLIQDLGLLIRHKLTQQKVALDQNLAPELPPVRADAAQLSQALLNLTLNAVEAMPDGGRLALCSRLGERSEQQGGEPFVEVEFRDTGVGMTEEQKSRAFTSLLSTTKTRGAGLGLAIVVKIVEAHGGRLSVESAPHQGTVIKIELPVMPRPESEVADRVN